MLTNHIRYDCKLLLKACCLILCLFYISGQSVIAQCNTGTEPECTCSGAPVLCTVDELDGYMFSMSSYQHPWDGPSPICAFTNTVSNNPTWFAFTAWCTDLDLNVSFANCTPSITGSIGAQIAIFSDCNYTPVDCNVSGADCNTNDKELNLTNLTIGDVYYFLVDGCAGSYCDITIDVIGVCGEESIEDWTNPISGDEVVCLGETTDYTVDDLMGAGTFHWFIDGMEVDMTSGPTNSFTWNNTGTYELCVDASNEPCVPITDDPEPICMIINVYDTDAGELTVDLVDLCPGDIANFSIANYNSDPEYSQAILITDQNGIIIEIITDDVGSFSSNLCGEFSICSYNYATATGTVPQIGISISNEDCDSECCDLICIPISFDDPEDPEFIDPPDDISLSCYDLLSLLSDLEWTDNCDGTGFVSPMESGSADYCNGGNITRTWEYTDGCGNTVTHSQDITIDAAIPPVFLNPPPDMTLACDAVPSSPPELTYSNSASGNCLIEGTIQADVQGSGDICGGTIIYIWEYIDTCNNVLNHTQNITIEPIELPEFINPPAHITISCNDIPPAAPDLDYTNNGSGGCLIEGTVEAEQIGNADICGGMYTYLWEFTDTCNNTILHVQNVLVEPIEPPAFINPPADITVSCDAIPTSAPDLNYTNSGTGICLVQGSVSPTMSGSADVCGGTIVFNWEFTDTCGTSISYSQNVVVDPAPLPTFINPPADITVSCDAIPLSAPDLMYSNNVSGICAIDGLVSPTMTGSADMCGGTITYTWLYTDACNQSISHVQNITVEPAAAPGFINPPADITVNCDAIPSSAPDLMYSNNGTGACLFEGMVSPVLSGSGDICGGTIQFTWTFTDPCNNPISHTQTITINPPTPPSFINPPADITVSCDAIPNNAPDLMYSNNGTSPCLFQGSVSPTLSGSTAACGGQLMFTWTLTNSCNVTITHIQTVTVEPGAPPYFVNPPADITVTCDAIPSFAPDLSYTNDETGPCGVNGIVSPVLNGSANPCGNAISYYWEYIDPCGNILSHEQFITIEASSAASFLNPPQDITVSCVNAPTSVPNLSYSNSQNGICAITGSVVGTQSGNTDFCGGVLINSWSFTDVCGRQIQHQQSITVEPASAAVFNNPPSDITVSCANFPANLPQLGYSNNEIGSCLIAGNVSPVLIGNANPCGGPVSLTWTFTDDCGRSISHTQQILIEPAAEATFINPPADITLDCESVSTLSTTLGYSNGQNGICGIIGSVEAIQSGSFDACGGDIQFNWSFTDQCNRTISHSQSIQVNPANSPAFIDPPADVTLACGDQFPDPFVLMYSNGSTGDCEVSGNVLSLVSNNGNINEYYWEFTDPCTNQVYAHTQTVEVSLAPDLSIDPLTFNICLGEDFDLSTILVNDLNNTNPDITYHTNTPPTSNNQLAISSVSPNVTTTYYIVGTNGFDCEDIVEFILNVDEPDFAGSDANGTICIGETSVDLFSYLTDITDFDGEWSDNDNAGVNLNNPYSVDFSDVMQGIYTFGYSISSTNTCPDDEALLTLTVSPSPEILIDSVFCQSGGAFYAVVFTSDPDVLISSSLGQVDQNGSTFTISNIPINQSVSIDATDPVTICFDIIQVNSPDCDCPNVTPPLSNGDKEVCFGSPTPTLSVTILAGLMANWYDASSGGNLLAGNTLTFTPNETNPGTYTYYVETESISDPGCVSNTRTAISLIINELPEANTAEIALCDPDGDGFELFNLTIAESQINGNTTVTFSYYLSMDDASNQVNPLSTDFNNTIPWFQTIYVVVEDNNGCIRIGEVNLIVHPNPNIILEVNNEKCAGDENGSVLVHANEGTSPYSYSLDSINWQIDSLFSNLSPGQYTVYVNDENGCLSSDNFEIADGLELVLTAFSFECHDNGTESEPIDDYYTFIFQLDHNQGNTGQFELWLDANLLGSFEYGSLDSITLNADGNSFNMIFQDPNSSCNIEQSIGPLNPCSTNCEIQFDQLTYECHDNGTTSFPDDDYYTIFINASSVNGSTNNSFNVFIGGGFVANMTYGMLDSISVPADGSSPIINIIDNDDVQCMANESIGPLEPCSNECLIVIQSLVFNCMNAGTIDEPSDDYYEISFEVIATNPGASGMFEVSADAVPQGIYNYGSIVNFNLAADGSSPTISVMDVDNPSCTDMVPIGPLSSCSTSCTLLLQDLNYTCHNNGTPSDNSDDFYTIEILVNATNGGPDNMYQVFHDNNPIATFTYNVLDSFILPADGSIVNLTIIDSHDNACMLHSSIGPLDPCSNDCMIEAQISNISCDPAGSQDDNSDDVFFFDLLVTGINSGLTWSVVDPLISGSYNVTETIGPFLISAGDLILDIVDSDDNTCSTQILINAPVPCSDPCEIDFSYFQISACDDNGTGATSDDDVFSISFVVNAILGNVSQFMADIGGNPYGPFDYGDTITINDLSANGQSQLVQILDELNGSCYLDSTFSQNACSSCDQIIDAGPDQEISCSDPVVTITGSSSEIGDYYWSGPNISNEPGISIDVDLPGTYYFEVLYPDACFMIDSLIVTQDADVPLSNAGPDQQITCLMDSVLIDGSSSSSSPDFIYEWTNQSGDLISNNISFYTDSMGQYYLQVIDTVNGCSSGLDLAEVTENFDQPQAIIYADPGVNLDCYIQYISLTYENQNNATFLWYVNNIPFGSGELIITEPALVILEVLDTLSGCEDIANLEIVDLQEYPVIQIEAIDDLDCENTSQTIDASNSQQNQFIIYNWYDSMGLLEANGSLTFEVTSPGWYYFEALDTINGCSNIDSIQLIDNSMFPDFNLNDEFTLDCNSNWAEISIELNGNLPEYTFHWTASNGGLILSGENEPAAQIEGAGLYYIEVNHIENHCTTIDSINILQALPPEFTSIEMDSITCAGESDGSLTINAIQNGTEPYQILVNGNPSSGSITNLGPGDYFVSVIDAKGCTTDTSFTFIEGPEISISLAPIIELTFGEFGSIEAIVNIDSSKLDLIQWTPSDHLTCDTCLSTLVQGLLSETYSIYVTTADGCDAEAFIQVLVEQDINITVPNVFTPNHDGLNEGFTIYSDDKVQSVLSMHVFDRWGENVFYQENFAPNDPSLGWDGTFRGKALNPAVYVYMFQVLMVDGSTRLISGDITLVR